MQTKRPRRHVSMLPEAIRSAIREVSTVSLIGTKYVQTKRCPIERDYGLRHTYNLSINAHADSTVSVQDGPDVSFIGGYVNIGSTHTEKEAKTTTKCAVNVTATDYRATRCREPQRGK